MLHIEKIVVDPLAPLPAVLVNGREIRPSLEQRTSETIYIIEARIPEEDTSSSTWNYERRGKSQVSPPPRKRKVEAASLRAEEETDWKIWALLGAGWMIWAYVIWGVV